MLIELLPIFDCKTPALPLYVKARPPLRKDSKKNGAYET
jgi:hypothetical protein